MNRQVRTTLVFGLLSALAFLPLGGLPYYWDWQSLSRIFAVAILTLYSLLLCRWSKTSVISVAFPLLLLGAMSFIAYSPLVFLLLWLIFFSWIRSGICFTKYPLRAGIAESATISLGFLFLVFFRPQSIPAQALTIWLFFLCQSLYFYVVPATCELQQKMESDPFDAANAELEQILRPHNGV